MNLKFTLVFPLIVGLVNCGLLRKPKVYNALITTDENLTSSRAYPLIQPVVHETHAFGYPFGHPGYPSYNPYNFYNTYYHQFPANYPAIQGRNNFQPKLSDEPIITESEEGSELEQRSEMVEDNKEEKQEQDQQNKVESKDEKTIENQMKPEQPPPIPLNEFGLPPSLIPINSYPPQLQQPQQQQHPINLQPYQYNSYPLIYDSFGGYNPNPYLPPYGYYPQLLNNNLPIQSFIKNQLLPPQPQFVTKQKELIYKENKKQQPNGESTENTQQTQLQDDIKNNSNKNENIADVPPPPLPSGAKSIE